MSAARQQPEPGAALLPGLTIRPMRRADLGQVLAVDQRAYPTAWPASAFERELGSEWSHLEVVFADPEPLVTIAHIVYWIVHDELHILNVAVDPKWRRRGIARAMLERVMAACERERLQYIALEVRAGNTAAIRLYKSFGFKQIGMRKRYYADNGDDALIMVWMFGEHEEQDRCQES